MSDVLLSALTELTTPADGDFALVYDVSEASNKGKRMLWSTWRSALKTYFDTLYMALTGNQTITGRKSFTGSIQGNIYSQSITAAATATVATLNTRSMYIVHARRNNSFDTMATAIVSTGTVITNITTLYSSNLAFGISGLNLQVTNNSSTDTIVTQILEISN